MLKISKYITSKINQSELEYSKTEEYQGLGEKSQSQSEIALRKKFIEYEILNWSWWLLWERMKQKGNF